MCPRDHGNKLVNSEILEKLRSLAETVAVREGCTLYDLEWVGLGRGRILRVFIDKPQAESRVSLDDCTKVSRGLNLLLDVENLIPGGAYHLEVSSPGLDRPLKNTQHYISAIGERVRLQLRRRLGEIVSISGGLQAARRLECEIKGCEGDQLLITVYGEDFSIPTADIEKAKVIFDLEKIGQPKEKRK